MGQISSRMAVKESTENYHSWLLKSIRFVHVDIILSTKYITLSELQLTLGENEASLILIHSALKILTHKIISVYL